MKVQKTIEERVHIRGLKAGVPELLKLKRGCG